MQSRLVQAAVRAVRGQVLGEAGVGRRASVGEVLAKDRLQEPAHLLQEVLAADPPDQPL